MQHHPPAKRHRCVRHEPVAAHLRDEPPEPGSEVDPLAVELNRRTGIVGTAIKFDRIDASAAQPAILSMRTLNRAAAEAIQALPAGAVHACTDITGFGLIGHASEMARASGVTVSIEAGRVPVFDGVLALARGNKSGGMGSNRDHFASAVTVEPGVDADRESLLYDPQTSGGLLIAASAAAAAGVELALGAAGVQVSRIGTVGPRQAHAVIEVRR